MRDRNFARALEAVDAAGSGQGNWRDVAVTAMDLMGADQGCFLCFDKRSGNVLAMESVGHDRRVVQDYADYYYQFDDVTRRGYALPTGAWLDARADQHRPDRRDQMYWSDFLQANRIFQVSAFSAFNSADLMAAVSVHIGRQRTWTHQRLQEIRQYRQALCAAFAQRQTLAEANLRLVREVLDPLAETYCVVSPQGYVVTMLEEVGTMLAGDSALILSGRMLEHRHPAWNRRLRGGLAQALRYGQTVLTLPNGWGRFYRLSMRPTESALTLGLGKSVGIRIERRDIFSVPDATLLGEMFGLTPAEAALCHHLVAGHAVKDSAALLGIAEATARKQLAAIFRKTSCSRQSELIRLVCGLVT